MEKYDIYKDIASRTEGDIYIGVVGPVRTGKSTFITKFMQSLVIPNISSKLQKQIATDELPQSADGKTIMTTQPKFVPANGVKVQFKNKSTANVKLIDCVGYFVDGAVGHEEEDKPRLVKTPWDENEIPFEKAAEIGTRKVIEEYSTVGVVVTTDGSFSEIERKNYVQAEEKVINQLKALNKPFVILLNSAKPDSSNAQKIAEELERKHGVSVVCVNALTMEAEEICLIMEKILLEFPMSCFNVTLPKWMKSLGANNIVISELVDKIKERSYNMYKMKDYIELFSLIEDNNDFQSVNAVELRLGDGVVEYNIEPKPELYFKVLSNECGENIEDDCQLISYIKSFAKEKNAFLKIKDALLDAEENGYGVVLPSVEEINLEQPILVKQGGRYGVKLKASAPSLHIMKVDVSTEVSPIVGTEKQSEDLISYITGQIEDEPNKIWETNMFGKTLHDLVNEGLSNKISSMPKVAQGKLRKTVTRIVNENRGGILCILL